MGMRFDELREEFDSAFGSVTLKQLKFLVKFAQHVRLRCRSNAALANYLRHHFGKEFDFQLIDREMRNGKIYKSIIIEDRK